MLRPVLRGYRPGMFRRGERREQAGGPLPLGARARVAALGGFPEGRGGGGAEYGGGRRVVPDGEYDDDVVAPNGAYDAAPRRAAADPPGAPTIGDEDGDFPGDAAGDAAEGAGPDDGPDNDRAPAGWVPDRRAPGSGRGRAWAARLTTAGPWGELAEKWVPEQLRGARVDPKRRGAVLLSAVAAIAAVAAALGVWWSRPQPTPVPAAANAASATASLLGASSPSGAGSPDGGRGRAGGTAADMPVAALEPDTGTAGDGPAPPGQDGGRATPTRPAAAEPSGTIVVSVTGNVRRPGVVAVRADARVADAIAAAGGALDATDLTGLNLAAHLEDGSSVVVVGSGRSTVTAVDDAGARDSSAEGGADVRISLNSADATALQTLSGIGPVTAEAIIAYRTEHGPFTDPAQLQEVSGIGPATFARLEPHVTL